MNFELFVFFLSLVSPEYSTVKGDSATIVITVDYSFFAVSHEFNHSRPRVSPRAKELLLTSLLLYFYCKHLEYSVAISNVLQRLLFVETAESHQRNISNITDCKTILEMSGIARQIN